MFIFQRIVTLQGAPRRTLEWATEMTGFVNANSDLGAMLWAGLFGYPVGTVAWTARVDSRAALGEGMDALLGNADYHDLIEKGQELIAAPGTDHLYELVHPESLGEEQPPVGCVAELITATPAQGKVAATMGWGIEISSVYASATGTSPSFFADAYGTFGQVTWIIVHADMAAADAANAAANSNAEYVAAVDGGGDLFVAGSGTTSAARRIA